jgi:hypothetical protein
MTRSTEIATARKVDTEVARLWDEFHKVNDVINEYYRKIERTRKASVYSEARRLALVADFQDYIEILTPKAHVLRMAARDYDEANYKGWTRFFFVQHIHNTQHCSSFRPTTRIMWLPTVSGLTEVEAVKEHGKTLCTICFPSAPTELTTAQVDTSICTGRRDYTGPSRQGYYSGNWGTCTDGCQRVTLTSSGKLRKHKKA